MVAAIAASPSPVVPLVDAVNPMIGAITLEGYGGHGLGKTFPGAATPFGMVQLSPDTVTGGDNGCGYSWHHKTIEGFSFFHLGGVGWYGDLGNFQVMPTTGPRVLDREQACSPFSHDHERAEAGYYRVELERYGVTAELAAAPRAGIVRFTFPATVDVSRVQIDLARRIGQRARFLRFSRQSVHVVDDHTLEGFMRCDDRDGGWGHGDGHVNYTVFFRAAFDRPFARCGVREGGAPVLDGARDHVGSNTVFFAEFPGGGALTLRAGFSYVDAEGARRNLDHDIPDFDFGAVRARAHDAWARAFGGVDVEGGTPRERTIFATALYHCLIDPREIADVDGRFMDATGRPRTNAAYRARTVFSGWDVFRSEFPLLTIIRPDVVSDTINSLMDVMARTGRPELPRWDLFGCASGCMIGHPAIPVIADAYQKGIRTFDAPLAYEQGRRSLEHQGNFSKSRHGAVHGQLSETLEFAYDDWCLGRLAGMLGRPDDAALYDARSRAYTNCWSRDVGGMRARLNNRDGYPDGWLDWHGREAQNQGTVESNPYQQGWFVPHDVPGLMALMGGREKFADELETFFEKTPTNFLWNNFYNHANEPCHHVAYLFVFAGRPWLTQKWTRRICENAYGDGVYGLCGNEDVGQMSAWYVLSALGLHPVCPGSGVYILTSPIFPKATLRLDPSYCKGRTFTITAANASPANIYIQSAALNGKPLDRAWITHAELAAGGTLAFVLGPEPNKSWGLEPPKGN